MMRKNIDYYMGLNYPVAIERIPEDDGGGFFCIDFAFARVHK